MYLLKEEGDMKKAAFLFLFFFLLLYVIMNKFTLGIIVLGVYAGFALLALKRNNTIDSVINISLEYSKKSKVVLIIFLFVGALTASWLSSGTIPGIVYFGIKFINQLFLYFLLFL